VSGKVSSDITCMRTHSPAQHEAASQAVRMGRMCALLAVQLGTADVLAIFRKLCSALRRASMSAMSALASSKAPPAATGGTTRSWLDTSLASSPATAARGQQARPLSTASAGRYSTESEAMPACASWGDVINLLQGSSAMCPAHPWLPHSWTHTP
jgi:hypothetical protein